MSILTVFTGILDLFCTDISFDRSSNMSGARAPMKVGKDINRHILNDESDVAKYAERVRKDQEKRRVQEAAGQNNSSASGGTSATKQKVKPAKEKVDATATLMKHALTVLARVDVSHSNVIAHRWEMMNAPRN